MEKSGKLLAIMDVHNYTNEYNFLMNRNPKWKKTFLLQ